MTIDEKLIKEASVQFNIDARVVEVIDHYLFLFLANRLRDKDDIRPIMYRYMGKFAVKAGAKPKK